MRSRKVRTKRGSRNLIINARKKGHGTVEFADADLGRASVEVEGAFFVDLGCDVGWGENLDTDFGCGGQHNRPIDEFRAARSEPYDVDCFDAIGGGKRTFGQRAALGEEAFQQVGNLALAISVGESRRGTHNDMSVPIGLHTVWKPGELRISQEFGPASEVEAGLRLEIRELNGDRHEVKMSMKSPRKQRGKGSRALAISCLGGLALLWGVCQAGLRINGTNSEPVGIYWAISKPLARGDLVFVLPPASSIFKLAKERGYLAAGPSPAGTCGLIKQVAAVGGDRVTIDSTGVRVNGIRLKNSAPRAADDAGRPMRAYELSDYALGSEEVFLMSDYNPASFDGRYFGPLSKTTIQSVIVPVLTWK